MGAEVARVVPDAIDEARFPAPQERQAKEVHAGRFGHDATVVADIALAVEHRYVQPRVVGAKPGKPIEDAYVESFNGRLREGC